MTFPPTTSVPRIDPRDPYWYWLVRRLGYLTNELPLLGQHITDNIDEEQLRGLTAGDHITISWLKGEKRMSSNAIQMLVEEGWRRSNELQRFLIHNPVNSPGLWPPKLLFLATLCYASTLAKFTDMERQDFMDLCAGFYDNISLAPPKDGQ